MKLTSIILLLYSIFFVNLVYSNDEFEQLFDLKQVNECLILNNKTDIKLPDKTLTPLQRLHRYINTFGNLQLYINPYSNKFYIVPLSRLNLIYGSAITIKILHEHNNKYVSLVYNEDDTIKIPDDKKEVTTENEIEKVTIETDKKITITDILTNNDSIYHIINQLEYGIFNSTNQIFLGSLYSSEYSKDLLISFQHNELTVRALISPYNSQLSRYYLFTKLLTSDLAGYIASTYKILLHKVKAKKQANDTK